MSNLIAWLFYIVIVVYNAVDAWQTLLLLRLGAEELNPIICWLIEISGSVQVIWIVKLIPLILLGIGLIIYQKSHIKIK